MFNSAYIVPLRNLLTIPVKARNKAPGGNSSKDPNAKLMYSDKCCAPGVYTEGGRYLGLLRKIDAS